MSLEVLQEAVVRLERELPEISAVAVSADECSGGTGICILTPYRCPQRGDGCGVARANDSPS